MSSIPRVIAAAAAAILTTKHGLDEERQEHGDQHFLVHRHIERLSARDPVLISYLAEIYSWDRKAPIDAPTPQGPNGTAFTQLADPTDVAATTAEIAKNLKETMESTSAKSGIVFGFTLELMNHQYGYGVIKADLEDDKRFFLSVGSDATWSLSQVRDILPPPQKKFAKYAISPRPRQPGVVGIRDKQADPDSAADYFLHALGLVVPRRSGTKLALAHAAMRSGYDDSIIHENLSQIRTDTPVTTVIERSFPNIPDSRRERLRGSAERPMMNIVADDPYCRKYYTSNPRFQLIADESVSVTVEGKTITVRLPADADPIQCTYVK